MTLMLRRPRSAVSLASLALCMACTDVVTTGGQDGGGTSSPYDTGPAGGVPDTGTKDTGSAGVADVGSADTGASDAASSDADPDTATELDAPMGPDSSDDADTLPTTACEDLEADYAAALTLAKSCTADADCALRRPTDPAGCTCDAWVVSAGTLDDIADDYALASCVTCDPPDACPALGNARCIGGQCAASATPVNCATLADKYKGEVSKAKACTTSEECRVLVDSLLTCGCPVYVNETYDASLMTSLSNQYHSAQCPPGEGCTACGEPLVGVCTGGKCATKTKAP